jgi:hypothetical protein
MANDRPRGAPDPFPIDTLAQDIRLLEAQVNPRDATAFTRTVATLPLLLALWRACSEQYDPDGYIHDLTPVAEALDELNR